MRSLALISLLAACSSSTAPSDLGPPDLAGADLLPTAAQLVGFWQEPGSGYIWRFTSDLNQTLGATFATIDSAPLTSGTWILRGGTLLLDNTSGFCASPPANQLGTYEVVLMASTLVFHLTNDSCPERSSIDNEVWTRVIVDGGP